jgi:hypothetical protein
MIVLSHLFTFRVISCLLLHTCAFVQRVPFLEQFRDFHVFWKLEMDFTFTVVVFVLITECAFSVCGESLGEIGTIGVFVESDVIGMSKRACKIYLCIFISQVCSLAFFFCLACLRAYLFA